MEDLLQKALEMNVPGPDHKNCCQTVFALLAEQIAFDPETAFRLGTCLGGGFMCGETCGALAGSLLYLGLKYGNSPETKAKGRDFVSRFRQEFGSVVCRELRDPETGRKNCAALVVQTIKMMLQAENDF